MNPKSGTMLKALLARFDSENAKQLLHFLPTYDFAHVEKCVTPSTTDFSHLLSPYAWIDQIHYSWFEPMLKALPQETAALSLSLFSNENQLHLTHLLSLDIPVKKPSPLISLFLSQFLKGKIEENVEGNIEKEDILARQHLPPSPSNKLLDLSKPQLLHLVDLLGIYDLAAELRQIVDKATLNKIYQALTKEQVNFLHYASQQPIKWTPEKLNLNRWDGERKILLSILHKRGIARLSKALRVESKSLIWHLCHKFDMGRGEFLMKLFAGKEDPAMISYFRGQLHHLLTRFKI